MAASASHSNQTTNAMAMKNSTSIEASAQISSLTFEFYQPHRCGETIFFSICNQMDAITTSRTMTFAQISIVDGRIVQKHFFEKRRQTCSDIAIKTNFLISHLHSMRALSSSSNQTAGEMFYFSFYFGQFGCHGNQSDCAILLTNHVIDKDNPRTFSQLVLSKYLQRHSNKCKFSIFPCKSMVTLSCHSIQIS